MVTLTEILYVINPKSNEGTALKSWEKAKKRYHFLPDDPVDITAGSLEKIIHERKPKIIVIAGGDGTINAVARTVFGISKKPHLAILPFGYGNALSYCLGVETLDKALDVIQQQRKTVTVDLLKTNVPQHAVGVFSVSVGFDARIVFNRHRYKYIGFRSYILAGIRSLVTHPEKEITFTIDKKVTLTARAS